ncbi:adenylosuccinate synthase [Paenibacillus mendelii]|uniref:Adenylosuccinate synthetase n=1 Tax=Paenibacillus mendelii TaxID=206163 RepID=A0ABV6J908_9BACL|nr:adenylosuccinate synthase [Paenibacillus mendelii]MCQ6559696.1 adenylosuccinate synthase [Paenibacillus mendelii]
MGVTAIVGANWGDEGKGKMTDVLAAEAEYVVRFQGGSNAGHTIINEYGKFALHTLPSGVFHPNVTNVIGPGAALHMEDLFHELDALKARGVPAPILLVSDRAQLVLPYHKRFDEWEEKRLGDRKFGSTKAGIAPFYADKYVKLGIQTGDLLDEQRLRRRVEAALEIKNILAVHLYGKPPFSAEIIVRELLSHAARLKPLLQDTTTLLHEALNRGERIVAEGQLGALRDPDHGIYPYSTSSSTLAGFASVGAGLPPYSINRVMAVIKAYSSAVGEGPLTAEISGITADELRTRGGDAGEYGATTGRPRRMGWFDAVATSYGCKLQGATEAALTNLDVLGYLDDIPICTAYDIEGDVTQQFPVSSLLEKAKPVFKTLPGWTTAISHIRRFEDLPPNAQGYVLELERRIGVPIRYVSVGPERGQFIQR